MVNEFPFRLDSQDIGSALHTHMGRVAFCSQHARQSKGCHRVLCAQNLAPFYALHPFQAMASLSPTKSLRSFDTVEYTLI